MLCKLFKKKKVIRNMNFNEIIETVLEHELGHALGYLHFNKINHVMNSKWTQGGWDTDGLERKQR